MEVTLRKAATLEKKLLETARGLALPTSVTVSIYNTNGVDGEVSIAKAKLTDNLIKAQSLVTAAFAVRAAIGAANSQYGVSTLLTEDALLTATEKLLTPIVGAKANLFDEDEVSGSLAEASARLEALSKRVATATDRYGASQDSVSVSVLDAKIVGDIQGRLASARRRKATISEELLSINMTKKVTLSAEAVALLEEFNLV